MGNVNSVAISCQLTGYNLKFKRQFAGRTFRPRRLAALDLLVFTTGRVDLGSFSSPICTLSYGLRSGLH